MLKSVVENIRKLPGINVHSTVLDIGLLYLKHTCKLLPGTGNGYTLIALAKAGFGSLLGTDYSAQAIELARKISDTRGFHNIELLIDDITHTKLNRRCGECTFYVPTSLSRFQLVVDKGTLDAIALCDVEERPGKISSYWQNVRGLMDASTPNSYFVITSCNFTAAELRSFAQQCIYCYDCVSLLQILITIQN